MRYTGEVNTEIQCLLLHPHLGFFASAHTKTNAEKYILHYASVNDANKINHAFITFIFNIFKPFKIHRESRIGTYVKMA